MDSRPGGNSISTLSPDKILKYLFLEGEIQRAGNLCILVPSLREEYSRIAGLMITRNLLKDKTLDQLIKSVIRVLDAIDKRTGYFTCLLFKTFLIDYERKYPAHNLLNDGLIIQLHIYVLTKSPYNYLEMMALKGLSKVLV